MLAARRLLAAKLAALRREASVSLRRPSMGRAGAVADERSYNWYEPGASLRRHGDEFHEETKGPRGWLLPTRRSITWLLYLNRDWRADVGAKKTRPTTWQAPQEVPAPASAPRYCAAM